MLTDGAPFIGAYSSASILTNDEFGVVGRPNAHYLKWTLNSHGYLGPEIRWDRARIMCIGASETFGFMESTGMEYPRQLERELNARAGSDLYQVVNVAYGGQSLRSASRRIDRLVADVKPSLVMVYPSSLLYVRNSDVPGDPVGWVQSDGSFESRFWTKFFHWVDSMPEWAATLRFKFHIWKVAHKSKVMERLPEENVTAYHVDLNRLLDHLQQKNIPVVLITHATRFGKEVRPEDRATLVAWRRFEPTLDYPGFLDMERRFNQVIRSEAAARNLLLVDASERMPPGRQNFADYVHFTDQGSHAMAVLIADTLLHANPSQVASLFCKNGPPAGSKTESR